MEIKKIIHNQNLIDNSQINNKQVSNIKPIKKYKRGTKVIINKMQNTPSFEQNIQSDNDNQSELNSIQMLKHTPKRNYKKKIKSKKELYTLFLKKELIKYKKSNPNSTHQEAMKIIGKKWREKNHS